MPRSAMQLQMLRKVFSCRRRRFYVFYIENFWIVAKAVYSIVMTIVPDGLRSRYQLLYASFICFACFLLRFSGCFKLFLCRCRLGGVIVISIRYVTVSVVLIF